MDKTRLVLIVLHILITVGLVHDLHPHLSFVANLSNYEKQASAILAYFSSLLRIAFYHCACILTIWSSRRYGAGIVRGTGILLVGELLDVLTIVTRQKVEVQHRILLDHIIDGINICCLVSAIILTFELARRVSKDQMDFAQLELLTTSINDPSMGGGGRFAIV